MKAIIPIFLIVISASRSLCTIEMRDWWSDENTTLSLVENDQLYHKTDDSEGSSQEDRETQRSHGGQRRCKDPRKIWTQCGLSCPLNCKNYKNPPKMCPASCVAGCACKRPFIFKYKVSGPCVLPWHCPNHHPFNILSAGQEECGAHQEFQTQGTACPDNCENYGDGGRLCTKNYVPGCFCQKPYIFLSGKYGACVLPDECPSRYSEYTS
ncbi:uncharacterized protein [Hyperolius riggenbachi]|uniref:uncharacterized protein isoform X2 n=1 Tax=Hyperolius riggenbachi TaxID=752182 RepID=UPI0035A33CB1